jgi:hypothetical protein
MGNEQIDPKIDQWRRLSWSSIIFGTILALAVSTMLHVLGIGVTASIVDPNSRASDNLATVAGTTGIWFLLSTAFGLFLGGFLASTLSRTFSDRRAAIYGLGVWALATLITMAFVVPTLLGGAGSAINTAGTLADRAANLLGAAGSSISQAAPSDLIDRVQRTLTGTSGNAQVDQNAVREITTLVGQRVTQGNWTPQQRDQLNNAVARAANISPDDARRRVDEAQTTIGSAIQQGEQRLRQAADTARSALAGAAYWAFASMLIGAIAALLGARLGEFDESDLPSFARMRVQPTERRRI